MLCLENRVGEPFTVATPRRRAMKIEAMAIASSKTQDCAMYDWGDDECCVTSAPDFIGIYESDGSTFMMDLG